VPYILYSCHQISRGRSNSHVVLLIMSEVWKPQAFTSPILLLPRSTTSIGTSPVGSASTAVMRFSRALLQKHGSTAPYSNPSSSDTEKLHTW